MSALHTHRQEPTKGWLRRPHPVLSRTVAGLCGGYLLASAGAILVTALCAGGGGDGKSGGDAMLAGALVGMALYVLAIIWAFATGSAARAWGGMLLATALLGLPGLLLLALPGGVA
ncbi:iron transporter [Rugamonas sp. CCM 8940]|uniref:iron transporter n=1 Tax=Rugamonas sp. CCM 8940 TaxID=2765359 RepID=UPI0018F37299|nr:iron transporter [Rugamonas sp. CCM 8940]MBJ7309304.1 iron transporter [Rugamonas sp. CCM 8940]